MFFSILESILLSRLPYLSGLTEAHVPDWARLRAGELGGEPVTLRSRLWSADQLRRIRLSIIESAGAFEAFNLLLIPFPACASPIFAAEFLAAGGKPRLAVIDFQDLRKEDPGWQAQWIDCFESAAAPYLHLGTSRSDMPSWTEAFFSRLVFHRKPPGEALEACFGAFDSYLSAFIGRVSGSTPLENFADVLAMEDAHRRYHSDHLANEPAVRTLGRLFGSEWATRYAREFLFDGA